MIIIYNPSGMLIGVLGVAAALVTTLVTGWMAVGTLAMAAVWFGVGLWWRLRPTRSGERRAFPALFFIPLPFWAVPLALFSVPLFFAQIMSQAKDADPRTQQLKADLRTLDDRKLSGDVRLSEKLLMAFITGTAYAARADDYHIFTRVEPDRLLVLIKAPNLSKYADSARAELLDGVIEILRANDLAQGRQVYVGVKGKLMLGAIRTPDGKKEISGAVPNDPLLAFYDPPPAAADGPR